MQLHVANWSRSVPTRVLLRPVGYAIGAGRQIVFFRPDLMIRLLHADRSVLLEVPNKFAMPELGDDTVSVRWLDPAIVFARSRNSSLDKLATELAAICERVATAATDPQATSVTAPR